MPEVTPNLSSALHLGETALGDGKKIVRAFEIPPPGKQQSLPPDSGTFAYQRGDVHVTDVVNSDGTVARTERTYPPFLTFDETGAHLKRMSEPLTEEGPTIVGRDAHMVPDPFSPQRRAVIFTPKTVVFDASAASAGVAQNVLVDKIGG